MFERLVDIICDKMSENLDADPNSLLGGASKGAKLEDGHPAGSNCNC